MIVERAPIGWGFDASTYIDPATVAKFVEGGQEFRIGYVRRDRHVNEKPDLTGWPVSLSRQELREHLDAGLRVSLVQFARFNGRNYLSAEAGTQIGGAAAYNAKSLGAPEGCTIWVDAEWTDDPPASIVIPYLTAWARAVYAAGYRPGCYVGFEGLTGEQWYSLPLYQAYWRSAMLHLSSPQPRGWCCFQGLEHSKANTKRGRPPVFGAAIDTDFATYDDKGSRFYLIAP